MRKKNQALRRARRGGFGIKHIMTELHILLGALSIMALFWGASIYKCHAMLAIHIDLFDI